MILYLLFSIFHLKIETGKDIIPLCREQQERLIIVAIPIIAFAAIAPPSQIGNVTTVPQRLLIIFGI